MKPVLSVLFVLVLAIVVAHCSSSSIGRINKRYYDSWEPKNDVSNNDIAEPGQIISARHKGSQKEDPCGNKPLWFLKNQARLGKLSPFHDCLNNHGVEIK